MELLLCELAGRKGTADDFRAAIAPTPATFCRRPFLAGAAPAYADFIVFAGLPWTRNVSDFPLMERRDRVYGWFDRMLGRFNGLARQSPGYLW
ncbi:MAG: hypothetical protein RBS99_05335 [Rhodospirillales bacterium]|jgi:glutathione S-transferase|nr:hypothetical protein [Rhodospirillales bacterium]